MGIGHLAVGLALKKAETRINAGWLVFAALFSDFLLGVFVLLGIEGVFVPADFASKHYLTFSFPFSHGLAASVLWTAVLAGLAALLRPAGVERMRAALLVAIAVFSHFLLDALTHVPELPLLGRNSYKLGLSLYDHLTVELALEVVMAVAAVLIYMKSTQAQSRRRIGLVIFTALLTLMMVGGQAMGTTASPRNAMAMTWVLMPVILGAVVFWFDRSRAAAV